MAEDHGLPPRTLKRLFRHANSFDDTAADVVERVLDEIENKRSSTDPSGLLPEIEYWVPILELIDEAGGSARGSAVIDALEDRLGERFGKDDHDVLGMGETRWRNRARFARLRMKEDGLISDNSPRGVWEITPAGRKFLAHRKLLSATAAREDGSA
jgi:hypothetical protein